LDDRGFREWLGERDVTNPLSRSSISNRVSRVRRVERELQSLGLDYPNLEAAYQADRMESVLARLRAAISEAEAGQRPPISLVPDSDNPANQMRNFLSAVRNYRQYRDEGAGLDSHWFVGAAYGGKDDQLQRFLAEGSWIYRPQRHGSASRCWRCSRGH
jgi:hypothetical protein